MPEVVQAGEGNLGSNASGVGAVMFNPTVDPLQAHLDNLKAIDETQAQRAKIQQQKLALVSKMQGALNPDFEGIFPADQGPLTDEAKNVNLAFQTYARSGIDPTNPASGQAYTDFNNKQSELLANIATSKSSNKMFAAASQRLTADASGKQELDQEVGSKELAATMAAPLITGERGKQLETLEQRAFVPVTPPLQKMIGDFVKKTYSKLDKTSSDIQTTPQGFMYQTTKAENFTPEQGRYVAENIPASGVQWQKSLNQQWSSLPPDKKTAYVNKYLSGNSPANPTWAEDQAKIDMAQDMLMTEFHQQSSGYKYLGITPAAKEAAKVHGKNDQLAAKYAWLPGMIADMHNGNPDVMSNQVYQGANGAPPSTVFGTTRLNALQLAPYKKVVKLDDGQGNMREQEVQFPNSVLMTFNKDGKVYIATSESVANADPKRPGSEFIGFSNPGETMTYLGQRLADKQALSGGWLAVDKKGARTSGSGFDAKKYAPLTQQQQQAQPAAQGAQIGVTKLPVTTGPAVKTSSQPPAPPKGGTGQAAPATIYSKSKSGKDIYSTDGGKTWNYK